MIVCELGPRNIWIRNSRGTRKKSTGNERRIMMRPGMMNDNAQSVSTNAPATREPAMLPTDVWEFHRPITRPRLPTRHQSTNHANNHFIWQRFNRMSHHDKHKLLHFLCLIVYWHDTVICLSVHPSVMKCTVPKRYILQQKCLNKWRGSAPRNMILQLSTTYTYSFPSNSPPPKSDLLIYRLLS